VSVTLVRKGHLTFLEEERLDVEILNLIGGLLGTASCGSGTLKSSEAALEAGVGQESAKLFGHIILVKELLLEVVVLVFASLPVAIFDVDQGQTRLAIEKILGVGALVAEMGEAKRENASLDELEATTEAAVHDADLGGRVCEDLNLRDPAVNPEHVPVVVSGQADTLGRLHAPDNADRGLLAQLQTAVVECIDIPLLPDDKRA
jgi:hypothetical protein